jgi:hypothetical protein
MALDKAMTALETLDPEKLEPIDVKRLAEVGVALRNVAAERLEKSRVTDIESVILHDVVMSNPVALDHVHALLALSAEDDLARTFEPPAPPSTN